MKKIYIVRFQRGGLSDLEDAYVEIFTTREMARKYLKHIAQRFRNGLREMNKDEEGFCWETIHYGCNRQDRQVFSYCGEEFEGEVISRTIDDAALFY